MKKSIKTILMLLVLLTSFILLSDFALAVGPYKPYLDYSASFDWNKTAANQLNITQTGISKVTYGDGTTATSGDLILGASVKIGALYNTATNNTHFDNGSGGGVTFELKNGTYTFLTATLTSMDVTLGGTGSNIGKVPTAISNTTFSDFNLTNISYGTGFSSRYIDELKSALGTGGAMGLSASFSFNKGDDNLPLYAPYDFKDSSPLPTGLNYSAGVIQGIVSAPEPVSSLLFVAGATVLGFSRYFRRRK